MTTINATLYKKTAATIAGAALVLSSFAFSATANAQSSASLQAQISALLAQIAALQAQLQGGATTAAFTRDLTIGSTGTDVTQLQSWLIARGFSIPAGATGYFGTQTRAAVAAYQVANGIVPSAGYFGPITRSHVNARLVPVVPPTTPPDDDDDDTLSGGEASLEDLNANSGDDNEVEEGETAQIAEFEFDVEDGDARIDRLDLTFEADSGNDEDEPWETFETISILDEDGDELASEDVSDEDDWLDEDEPYVFRFTNLDYIVREGEMGTLIIEVEAQNSVDGADDEETWTVYIDDDGIRAEDGAGIQQYLGDDTETVDFDVVEEGEGEELNISTSPDDPDSTTLQVEDDERSDMYTIFAFELDAEDNDIELDEVGINLTTSDEDVSDVINDAVLVIDGEEFDDFDWVSPTGSDASMTFDIDGDFVVEDGETVTVEYMVEFNALTGNYAEGTTIQASTTGSLITGEGADDVTADGSAEGELHTLRTSGIDVTRTDRSAETTVNDGNDNDYATFMLEVEVTAFEDDAYISQNGTVAYDYQIENASTGDVLETSTATTSIVSSSADTQGSSYRVNEGDTETFTFTVTLDPASSDEGRSYRMQLLSINFGDSAGTPTGESWTAVPAPTYETPATFINN